ncbi:MAG: hypothetical protein HYS14_06950 [Candidatus Rokubacteria bacterium]|nr:hypothetical protein [Candidatus Rokubacteria bacterium]
MNALRLRWAVASAFILATIATLLGGTVGSGLLGGSLLDGTLSADPWGWASNPVIAADDGGTLYAAWAQHRRPGIWELSAIYVKKWANGQWEQLGGRIGHARGHAGAGATWPSAYAPSIALLGKAPYVAWYEGGGYGWGTLRGVHFGSSAFVAHWDGARWVEDPNTEQLNGALNTDVGLKETGYIPSARRPKLAVVSGRLYAAWIETRVMPGSGVSYNVLVVKHLQDGRWVQDGKDLWESRQVGDATIIDLAIADLGGEPWIAWSESKRRAGYRPAAVRVARLSLGDWVTVGDRLNVSPRGYANYLAMAGLAGRAYVAWQERPSSGNNRIYVKHWDGSRWVAHGDALNADPDAGEAGRAALVGDEGGLWLTWPEGRPGQRAKLYVRSFGSTGWSAPLAVPLRDSESGAADTPALAISRRTPYVIWAEKSPPPATKQIYVRALP